MSGVIDDRGYNQGFELVYSTRIRMKRRADMMLKEMRKDQACDVLEIGCGRGEVSYWIAESSPHNILGTDICQPFIKTANENYSRSNCRFEVMDFNRPDQVAGRTFDYIIGNGILHHLYPTLAESLIRMRQMLNENGRIIFMEPNIYNPYCFAIFNFARKFARLEPDEMAFSKTFILKQLRHASYSQAIVEYRDFLLPGIPPFLVKPSIAIGNIAEKVPVVKMLSQSIFIVAKK